MVLNFNDPLDPFIIIAASDDKVKSEMNSMRDVVGTSVDFINRMYLDAVARIKINISENAFITDSILGLDNTHCVAFQTPSALTVQSVLKETFLAVLKNISASATAQALIYDLPKGISYNVFKDYHFGLMKAILCNANVNNVDVVNTIITNLDTFFKKYRYDRSDLPTFLGLAYNDILNSCKSYPSAIVSPLVMTNGIQRQKVDSFAMICNTVLRPLCVFCYLYSYNYNPMQASNHIFLHPKSKNTSLALSYFAMVCTSLFFQQYAFQLVSQITVNATVDGNFKTSGEDFCKNIKSYFDQDQSTINNNDLKNYNTRLNDLNKNTNVALRLLEENGSLYQRQKDVKVSFDGETDVAEGRFGSEELSQSIWFIVFLVVLVSFIVLLVLRQNTVILALSAVVLIIIIVSEIMYMRSI
jgi:hypothetical protein